MLPAPNLDDRRFQDLVDDAKRLVQQRCPEWTDHNVSDPGVTLIEAYAFMVDQLLYRLNRVPDLHYIRFLELIGVQLYPPTAAHADVTFWLSAPQLETVTVAAGTQVATLRTETQEAISFSVTEDLDIVACSLGRLGSTIVENTVREHADALAARKEFYCFDQVPKPGDALLIGLTEAVPSCAVVLRFDCEIEGVGVDPRFPPVVWEAWDGDTWERCEVDHDETGGLNRAGDVVLHVPRGHVTSLIARQRAGWIRCRVVASVQGQPAYSASPKIKGLTAHTIGGTARAEHADIVTGEILGVSEATPGQRFSLARTPVVASGAPDVLEISSPDGWEQWTRVTTFASSGPDDRHFLLDATSGTIDFGPTVRGEDGAMHRYGAVAEKGAVIRIPSYRTGGGRRGNVARGTITVLKSSIPYITRVENRAAAAGGVDGEDVDSAKQRGPLLLRTRDRAVTAEDYEYLARQAAPEVARVRCAPGGEPGAVRVLVVPSVADTDSGKIEFLDLLPDDETVQRVAGYLDERRVIGARIVVEPPTYMGVTVVARLRGRSGLSASRLQAAALQALYRWLHPVTGGPGGTGWPFGRPVQVGDVYAVLGRVEGVELVEDVRLYAADPTTGQRGDQVQRLDLDPTTLVFSYEHQVRVG